MASHDEIVERRERLMVAGFLDAKAHEARALINAAPIGDKMLAGIRKATADRVHDVLRAIAEMVRSGEYLAHRGKSDRVRVITKGT